MLKVMVRTLKKTRKKGARRSKGRRDPVQECPECHRDISGSANYTRHVAAHSRSAPAPEIVAKILPGDADDIIQAEVVPDDEDVVVAEIID